MTFQPDKPYAGAYLDTTWEKVINSAWAVVPKDHRLKVAFYELQPDDTDPRRLIGWNYTP